ncbi:type IV pilus assembly protein PilM [Agromyces sp. MMS24-JH15]|uniref:type IV pilus assembly protein PilM n=1 Tax=Agromyces sp. MMS24-JH15 TaxID=3243765 RepID=UPI00374A4691
MAHSIVGIDIGSRSIRAAEISDPAKRPTLTRWAEEELPAGAVVNGEVQEPTTVAQALRRLWSKGKFSTRDVVLGIGNQRVLARDFSIRSMPIEQIREALPFEARDVLPVPAADAILDFHPIQETRGEHGLVLNGLLVAAVKEAVLGNVRAVESAGLTPHDVDLIPFALSRSVTAAGAAVGTVAIVDIGAQTTSTVIARDGVPQFVRIVPTGGDDITAALQNQLELDPSHAEGVKRELGILHTSTTTTVDGRPAADVIQRVVGEQLTSLRNTIVYYTTSHPNDPVSHLVVTGGGSTLPGLREALSELTQLQVVVAQPLKGVKVARSVNADLANAARDRMSVAVGLALGWAA